MSAACNVIATEVRAKTRRHSESSAVLECMCLCSIREADKTASITEYTISWSFLHDPAANPHNEHAGAWQAPKAAQSAANGTFWCGQVVHASDHLQQLCGEGCPKTWCYHRRRAQQHQIHGQFTAKSVGLRRVSAVNKHFLHIADPFHLSQDSFVESYLNNQRSHVFSSVAVMIFVIDISSREPAADMINFAATLRALHEHSPGSKLFILIHKMDLVPTEQKIKIFHQKTEEVRTRCADEGFTDQQVEFWATSIWDQSLYRAWTQVLYFLVPNAATIEGMLRKLADLLDARELILYERTTCLAVTHITRDEEANNPYTDRFERISSILKTHKHSMAKHTGMLASETSFAEMQIKTGAFMFFITRLTENTNLAVVMPSDEATFNAARVNVQLARREFAQFDIVEKKTRDLSRQDGSRSHGYGPDDDVRGIDDVDVPIRGYDE